ncbi:MAG: chromate resistance protein [Deltaproteobacteria bacterium]|nr:chromate resistance protein [Deltaproteobacteria bacterium]
MWLIFSYSLPAKNSNARVKVWRRLMSVGAVQLKSSLYVLPAGPGNHEHFQWLSREVEELGGEAVFFQCPAVENMTDLEIRGLFGKERNEDYDRLCEEMQTFARALGDQPWDRDEKVRELKAALKKFTRRFETIRDIDFFPTGRGERPAMLLASMSERMKELTGVRPGAGSQVMLKKEDYRGKIWVTRERPYVDRLASFWLVRRFIDKDADILFISPKQEMESNARRVYFDMAGGEFTHREQMITFEVLAGSFGLLDQGGARLAALVRAIDLKEDLEGMGEAKVLQDLVDGLVKITPDDYELVNRALMIFDALYTTYQGETP